MMNEVKQVIKSVNFTPEEHSRAFVWSFAFAGWETDEVSKLARRFSIPPK